MAASQATPGALRICICMRRLNLPGDVMGICRCDFGSPRPSSRPRVRMDCGCAALRCPTHPKYQLFLHRLSLTENLQSDPANGPHCSEMPIDSPDGVTSQGRASGVAPGHVVLSFIHVLQSGTAASVGPAVQSKSLLPNDQPTSLTHSCLASSISYLQS